MVGGGEIFDTNLQCRRALVDTGSPLDLEQTGVEKHMKNAAPSNIKCMSASSDAMQMSKRGDILYTLRDTLGEGGEYKISTHVHTSPTLPVPLFSVDKLFHTGDWDFLLRDSKRGGPAFIKYNKNNTPTNCIPLEYDYENKCTWSGRERGGSNTKTNKYGWEN